MAQFKVGDKVTWRSQAGGCTKKKVGTVVVVVPSGTEAVRLVPNGMRMKSGPMGQPRNCESYLVAPVGYGTEVLWPLVSKLMLVKGAYETNYVESVHHGETVRQPEAPKPSHPLETTTAPKPPAEPSSQDGCTC